MCILAFQQLSSNQEMGFLDYKPYFKREVYMTII